MTWAPECWRTKPAAQQPNWPNEQAVEDATAELRKQPPLVFAGEARSLINDLERAHEGKAFLLVAGDCAESFEAFSANAIRDKLKIILQMAAVLTYGAGVPTVKVGRMAGQFAKWRSSDTETRNGVELPSFRGDMVNEFEFTPEARTPDPTRLVRAYHQSASTLNLLRALTKGGFADIGRVHAWNLEFVEKSPTGQKFQQLSLEIERALNFMIACGINLENDLQLHQVDFYTAHEALLLNYEEALTRTDSITGEWYDCSAHLIWIGARTTQLDGAHVEYLSGVRNPIGVKISPDVTPELAVALAEKLNPERRPGRLTFFSRMGNKKVKDLLPPILDAVKQTGIPVLWACDPVHANTFVHASGFKTRHFDDILGEVTGFFDVCQAADVWPGGIHVELTGEDVTECLGGAQDVGGEDLENRYETLCDPRLNASQSLELAFQVAELLRR